MGSFFLDLLINYGDYIGKTTAGAAVIVLKDNKVVLSKGFHIVPEENFAVIVLTNQAGEMDLAMD